MQVSWQTGQNYIKFLINQNPNSANAELSINTIAKCSSSWWYVQYFTSLVSFFSLSRLYVLQHFPMDVIGGTVIGVMLAGVMANRTKLYQIFDKSKS